MPLGDGSPGVGQHVGPVAQLRPRAVEAHKDLADGIVLADLVIVQNSYNNLHFLWSEGRKARYCQIGDIDHSVIDVVMVVTDSEKRQVRTVEGGGGGANFWKGGTCEQSCAV